MGCAVVDPNLQQACWGMGAPDRALNEGATYRFPLRVLGRGAELPLYHLRVLHLDMWALVLHVALLRQAVHRLRRHVAVRQRLPGSKAHTVRPAAAAQGGWRLGARRRLHNIIHGRIRENTFIIHRSVLRVWGQGSTATPLCIAFRSLLSLHLLAWS